jgi:hypothetical protein
MSQVTVVAAGIPIVLNLPNGPLPTIDPLTGTTWANLGSTLPGGATPDPQPGTYSKDQTNPSGK